LIIENALDAVKSGQAKLVNKTKGLTYIMLLEVSQRQKEMLLAGGLINLIKLKK
jgi:aconitate hydratase